MNDEQLQIFILVAKSGSFSKAEENAYISKQAMLKQINALENEIGFPLFTRNRSGVTLTDAGEHFYTGIQKIINEKQDLLKECISLSQTNVIRISNAEHQVLLDPVNTLFVNRYPQFTLKRIVHPNHSGEWKVENGIQDVAETFDLAAKKITNANYLPLTAVPYYCAVSHSHPLASKRSISLKEISEYSCYIFPLMIKEEYLKEIEQAFALHPENLLKRNDVDHQVEAAYECIHSTTALITANPFIHNFEGLHSIPLKEKWTREYGILYPLDPGIVIEKYVSLAKEIYTKKEHHFADVLCKD